jgi:predicted nucleotidyltransferase
LLALPERYWALFDRVAAQFAGDDRVRAMWLHGAIGRGQADAGSDLDVSVTVRDEDFDEFSDEWRDGLAAITPTLTARPISPGSFYALTPACERLDVIAERVSDLPGTSMTRRITVFDRDGLSALIPPPADPPPDPVKISYLIEETLRQAANFPTVVVRDDWLLGVIAVQQVQLFLYELFAESNKPAPATGPKQWSFKLNPRQRSVLARLPVAAASAQSVLTAREAALAVFLAEAPLIAARSAVPWPDELEWAVRVFLAGEGFPLPEPRSAAAADS